MTIKIKNLLPSALAQGAPAKQRLFDIASESQYNTGSAATTTPSAIAVNIIIYALGFLGTYFLILVIVSGVQWMTAGGNNEKVEKAQSRIKNAVIGFALVAAAYAITILANKIFSLSLQT